MITAFNMPVLFFMLGTLSLGRSIYIISQMKVPLMTLGAALLCFILGLII